MSKITYPDTVTGAAQAIRFGEYSAQELVEQMG